MTDLAARYDILFLWTGNSACSHPKGTVHPGALRLPETLGRPTAGLRPKSWDEFGAEGASGLDFVVIVCDDEAGEVCPIRPGKLIHETQTAGQPA